MSDVAVRRAERATAGRADVDIVLRGPAGSGAGATVTIDADGTVVVDGTTVELATDAQLTAGLADKADAAATTSALATKSDTGHAHAAPDITSGILPIARLATGTPDGSKFIRDDGTLAVPGGGDLVHLETITLAANAGSVDFSASLSGYRHIRLVGKARSNRAAPVDVLALKVNGVTTGMNYRYSVANGATGFNAPYQESGSGSSFGYIPAASATAGTFAVIELLIADIQSTTDKPMIGYAASREGISNCFVQRSAASAITAIGVYPVLGTLLLAGSTFSLYGVK